MPNPLRLGLIGCGGIVQLSHAPSYLAIPSMVDVVALADPVEANLAHLGTTFDVPPTERYADYHEMLAQADLDVVTIATPHHLHVEHALNAIAAGVAVISEKPMALTLADADAILAAAAKQGVAYSVVHNFLFAPGTQRALARMQSGELGQTLYGRAKSLFSKSEEQADPKSVWRASKVAGGGALNDTAYHEIYLVEALVGSPICAVEARIQTSYFEFAVDDLALLFFDHQNGAVSTVSTGWAVPGSGGGEIANLAEVHAKGGSLRVERRGQALWQSTRRSDGSSGGWEEIELPTLALLSAEDRRCIGHVNYFAATCAALVNGMDLPVTGQQARHNLAIIEAARQATIERSAIPVE
ncbi:MAG: Gfo/Idh/MocA family oxidoreductase [Chloroflexota bacterium]